MTRCAMCDYSHTTDSLSGEAEQQEYRSLHFDWTAAEHYCSVCILEWSLSVEDFTDTIPPEEDEACPTS